MSKRFLPAAIATLCLVTGVVHADDDVVATARFTDRAQLQAVASRFQHVTVDRARGTVRFDASPEDIAALRAQGIAITVDRDATAKLQAARTAMRDRAAGKSIPGYACYRTVEETQASMDQLATLYPSLASVASIGPSWQRARDATTGYDLRVLRMTNSATDARYPDKPVMMVFSSIHAREYTPAELLTRFAEWLVTGHGEDDEATWLLDHFQFHFVLQANPDGRKKAETGLSWRKNTNGTNGSCSANSAGIDLNRNFPFHWSTAPGGSSGNACAETYRGPSATSEPETQALLRYVAGLRNADGSWSGGVFPDRRGDALTAAAPLDYRGVFLDVHSYSQLVLWSWGDTTAPAPNQVPLRTLGRRIAWFNGYRPQQSNELYATDGTTDDTMYGLLGVPSYTIELGTAFFESCSSFTTNTAPKNLDALRYVARTLQAPYRLPAGPDTTAIAVTSRTVAAGVPVTVTATVDDGGFNQGNGTEATQRIASASAFLDAAPWDPEAVARPMTAVDGAFDTTREQVRLEIPTIGLAAGVHTVFVQGVDASGQPGTPQAVRFTITGGPPNTPPVAAFAHRSRGKAIGFINMSRDPDGRLASSAWTFGDGQTSTRQSPTHVYAQAGSYQVTVTVTDDRGATATVTRTVEVR